ncbi:Alpha/beta hydrolase fold-3 [Botryosphaeria dothidea]|uniref:Alpha/beta hydrolase fold-3 n=1 Tax=Botryosphaeria dothidea TaxID=55169 RepID=A0A8H4J6K5_9PEZI|nr:Alpha/beta hydrolase fold-3 [Botryosphaeria dothidea]
MYDTYEEVEKLGVRDPEFTDYLKENGIETITDFSQLPGLDASSGNAAHDPGYEIDVPMRDGYLNPLRVHKPKNPPANGKSALVVMIYGGGFVMGDNTQMSPFSRALNQLHGATAVNLTYRLAPANPFPAAPNDVWDNLKWIVENTDKLGADPSAGFIIAGGSAGGNLAAVSAQKWIDQKLEPRITGLYLAIPVIFDEENVPEEYKKLWFSRRQNADALVLNGAAVDGILAAYAPDRSSPDWSPMNVKNHSTGFPPVYISVCGADPLRDDGLVYARILRDKGTEVKMDVSPGLPHGHVMFKGLKSGSKSNIDGAKAFGWLLGDEKTTDEILAVIPEGNLDQA